MDNTKHEFETHETLNGVIATSTETEFCYCSWIQIQDENGAEEMGKPIGNYITIETDILEHGKMGDLDEIAKTVSEFLLRLTNISDDDSILVVGIGNRNILADSLGVRVTDKVIPTRHTVEEINNQFGTSIRTVSVISPGVMGTTGMSTAEIVKSICSEMKPSLVILIDALVALKTHRLYSTIQLSDTGLTPSGGISKNKNNTQTINSDYLGIPVIGIGVPTVINVANIMVDFISSFSQAFSDEELDASLIESIHEHADSLFPSSSSFVSIKEIDVAIQYSSYIISTAINMAMLQENWLQIPYNHV